MSDACIRKRSALVTEVMPGSVSRLNQSAQALRSMSDACLCTEAERTCGRGDDGVGEHHATLVLAAALQVAQQVLPVAVLVREVTQRLQSERAVIVEHLKQLAGTSQCVET